MSTQDITKALGDNQSLTAVSQLRIAPKEDEDSVKGPAESVSVAYEEDQARRSCARMMYTLEERTVGEQV